MEEFTAFPMISSVSHHSSKLILSISYIVYCHVMHARSHVHIISFAIMVSLCSCYMIVELVCVTYTTGFVEKFYVISIRKRVGNVELGVVEGG